MSNPSLNLRLYPSDGRPLHLVLPVVPKTTVHLVNITGLELPLYSKSPEGQPAGSSSGACTVPACHRRGHPAGVWAQPVLAVLTGVCLRVPLAQRQCTAVL
jgi:hypothetical protein